MTTENIKPRRVITQPYDYSVQDLVDKIESEDIELRPDFQRNYVWATNDEKENKRSRLIESLILNIPIPVIYFAEKETLEYEVIDGQQRLQTLKDFLDDKFLLHGLEIREDLIGKKYSDLDKKTQDLIRKRSIRAIVILNDSDEDVKFKVFERLNLGSIPLTSQEIRNNTMRGKFNDLLKELAKNTVFRKLLKLKLIKDSTNMAYEEMILRFFAYYEKNLKRSEILSTFLTRYMKEKENISDEEIQYLKLLFLSTINKINKYLGDVAFSNLSTLDTWNPTSNRAVYDAEMLSFASIDDVEIVTSKEVLEEKLKELMKNEKFKKSLDEQSGGKKIEYRVDAIKNLLTKN